MSGMDESVSLSASVIVDISSSVSASAVASVSASVSHAECNLNYSLYCLEEL